MLPAILTLIVLACGGGFFVFKKVQEKKKEQEAAKPDPDADYVPDHWFQSLQVGGQAVLGRQ